MENCQHSMLATLNITSIVRWLTEVYTVHEELRIIIEFRKSKYTVYYVKVHPRTTVQNDHHKKSDNTRGAMFLNYEIVNQSIMI